MRVLIFHGYLLRGTGSNIYTASLARTLVAMGHEVHLLCQDRAAADVPFVDALGEWVDGGLSVRVLREPVRCTAYLPDIGRLLPVYVADDYEGFDARPLPEMTDAEIARYVDANAAAVADVAAAASPEVALANHLVMGPLAVARGLAGAVPYAVKIHGSALEYTVRPHRKRFLPYAEEGLAGAGGVLVGSRHTAESLWEVMADERLPARTRLGPPGVDVHAFRRLAPEEARDRLRALAERLDGAAAADWGGEAGAAAALRAIEPGRDRVVSYVGKLIVSKGVDLLLAAWPLVCAEIPGARLCVVGFGTYREGLGALRDALARGDLDAAREIARRGRELEGGPPGELAHLASFLDGLEGKRRERYLRAAPAALERVDFTGRLEHGDLPDLLPACEAQVVPSTFPEAFGMVAAEAACCGALPVSASHSGLAEVTATLAPALPAALRPLLSFDLGPGAVEDLAARLCAWLSLPEGERAAASAALAEAGGERFGWERVADGVIAAAQGRLDGLPPVPPAPSGTAPSAGASG
ncbi:MAG TPA: glycosyltransferase family 4 protein [Thermoleophilaceae bacterium]|nr:glycosyltransferase family 4 protein [Thermoleophilaceae bacterium]